MKKILSIIAILSFSIAASAQHTSSRWDTYGQYDASSIGFRTYTLVDTAGGTQDTLELRPYKMNSYYKWSAVDSAALRVTTSGCYYGDQLVLDITNAALSNIVTLVGNFRPSTGTARISLTSGKSTRIWFEFDGTDWVERSRIANYTR